MKKRFLSLLCVLALCLGLLPVTALAAEGAPSSLYVGNQQVISGNDITYWTTGTDGKLTASNESGNWNVKYDPSTVTLSLQNAKISGGNATTSPPYGAGIYAQCNSEESVSLTIKLISENTITGFYGIYVNAEISADSYGTDASLTITGESNGSLKVSGSYHGIYVKSGTGGASLNINDASVVASSSSSYSSYAGVYVQSSAHATSSPQLSLAVNGGSLTTSASEGNDGIQFYVGLFEATGATTSLTVSDNAIVRANGGIKASRVDEPTPSGTGIVFDGTEGTVYGNVELQEDLKIGEGESLTIGKDASLTVPSGTTLTNNGTVTTTDGGSLTNQGTINNSGTLPDSIEGSQPPKITTASLPYGEVDKNYSQPLAADNNPTSWSVTNGTLPNGLTLENGTISGIPTAAGTSTFTVKAENTAGSDSKELTLTINPAPVLVTSVALNKSELSLYTGQSEILTATVQPEDATNKNVTWSSSDGAVATVDANGNVTAVAPGTATITVTTDDGNKTAVCTVTVSKRSSSGSSGGSDSEPSYSPILETEGEGTVKVDPRTPGQGDEVTVTPTPDRGWDVGSVTVTDRNGREIDVTERRNSTWTFEQPRGRVTIAVTFVPAGGTAPFADVPEGHWAEAAIRYVWENGLMNGTSAASFNPGGTLSRQQVWMILARMAGADPADMAAAKAWAVDSGISDGTSPGGAVTRQQFAALLYRFAVTMGYDVSVGESTNILSYADAFDAAEYAIPALQWACGAGIIHGTGDGSTLSPQGTATRAQAAVMLERFCEWNK